MEIRSRRPKKERHSANWNIQTNLVSCHCNSGRQAGRRADNPPSIHPCIHPSTQSVSQAHAFHSSYVHQSHQPNSQPASRFDQGKEGVHNSVQSDATWIPLSLQTYRPSIHPTQMHCKNTPSSTPKERETDHIISKRPGSSPYCIMQDKTSGDRAVRVIAMPISKYCCCLSV